MGVKQYRADVSQSLLAISPEQIASSSDNFTASGAYAPDFHLLDAKNVLPTATGYTSYFGTDLDFDTVDNPPNCQDIITYRTGTGDTLFLAMCKDGLWMKSSAGNAQVVQNITIPDVEHIIFRREVIFDEGKCWWIKIADNEFGAANPWALWTYAIVNNKIFFYQQGIEGIIRVRGQEKGIVYVDKFEPTYIIGDTTLFIWVIHGVDSSISCTDTKKEIIIPNAGTFTAFRLDKAHYVKNVISQWREIFSSLSTFGMDAEVNSQSQVSIDGTITISQPAPAGFGHPPGYGPGPAPGQRLRVCVEVNDDVGKVTDTYGVVELPIGGTEDNNWTIFTTDDQQFCRETTRFWRMSGFSAGDPDQLPAPARIGGGIIEFDPITTGQCVEAPETYIEEYTSIAPPPYGGSNANNTWFMVVNYEVTAEVYEADSNRWPETYYFQEALRDGDEEDKFLIFPYIYDLADGDLEGTRTYRGTMIMKRENNGTPYHNWLEFSVKSHEGVPGLVDPINTKLTLSNAKAWHPFVFPEGFDWPLTSEDVIFDQPGLNTYGQWEAFLDNVNGVVHQTVKFDHDGHYISIIGQLDATIDPIQPIINTRLWVRNTTGAAFNLDAFIRVQLLNKIGPWAQDPIPSELSCGWYVGPSVPDVIDSTTPGAGIFRKYYEDYEFNDGNQLDTANVVVAENLLQVGIPENEFLVIWCNQPIIDYTTGVTWLANLFSIDITQAHPSGALSGGSAVQDIVPGGYYCSTTGSDVAAEDRIGVLPLVTAEEFLEYFDITVEHNGKDEELITSYEPATGVLSVGGFKEFALTEVTINNFGEAIRSFSVSSLLDSNGLFDKLASEMQAAFFNAEVIPAVITPASANIDYNLTVRWMDFNQKNPTLTLDQDGDCFWNLQSSTSEQIAMAQVSGIASARGRLVAWDRQNAVYTSSNSDPMDFVPDIATQANVGKLQAVQGNIMQILGWKNGFIVYSTGNIVRANYTGGTYVFDYKGISDSGIIDPRHVSGNLDSHFAWTNKGLISVDAPAGKTTELTPEMLDWFSQHPFPIKVSYLNDRYVVCSIISRPPGIYSPYVRSGIEVTNNRAGTGLFATRPTDPVALLSMPFGYNMYPIYTTAMVHDIVLGKWGVAVLDFYTLFSLNPINAKGYPAEKAADYSESLLFNESRSLAGVTSDDRLVLFNDSPDDSYLCFGHTKFQVKEWSRLKQVTMEFVDYAYTTIQVEPSYDGRTVNWDAVEISAAGEKAIQDFYVDIPGDWFNIVVRGTYHLRSFTVKGFPHGSI